MNCLTVKGAVADLKKHNIDIWREVVVCAEYDDRSVVMLLESGEAIKYDIVDHLVQFIDI